MSINPKPTLVTLFRKFKLFPTHFENLLHQ